MGWIRGLVSGVAFLLLLQVNAYAQSDEVHEDLKAFFERDTPALLFEVDGIDLTTYGGGIGIMFPGNTDFQWRFAIGVGYEDNMYESLWRDTVRDQTWNNTVELRFQASPLWLLNQYDRFVTTISPVMGYSLFRAASDRHMQRDPGVVQVYEEERYTHFFTFGGRFGFGVALTEAIFLHAEYELLLRYGFSASENTRSGGSDEPEWHENEYENWSGSNFLVFSLGVRL
ncbi:MAG: hypothetical protein C0600_02965 [Ignavibacteria bacterium]|nr:MAG: hypothetical protein C0600_02965 [Ignavibacteria bacterium]